VKRRAVAARAGVALVLALALAPALAAPTTSTAETSDFPAYSSLFGELLEQYTKAAPGKLGTRVDYPGLLKEARWKQLVGQLASVDPAALETRSQRLAFWINAYNILAIDLVLGRYPVASIRDIGSFFSPVWKAEAGRIGGKARSLAEIEHEILRPLGEPRIHAAIVCASVSCPDLRREPFEPALDRESAGGARGRLLRLRLELERIDWALRRLCVLLRGACAAPEDLTRWRRTI